MLLQFVREGEVVFACPLQGGAVHVGRSPTNDVVLREPRISSRHVVIWQRGDELWIEDLGSRNGTTIDDRAVSGATVIPPGATVTLGGAFTVRVQRATGPEPGALLLEDVSRGVLRHLRTDRLRFGPDGDVPTAGAGAVLLITPERGLLWRRACEDDLEVRPGQPFEVDGLTFVLRASLPTTSFTETLEITTYPYTLVGSLAEVVLSDDRGGTLTVRSELRVALLYVLGRAWEADDDGPDRGWRDNDAVALGIWGRAHHEQHRNNLNVLVHRVRRSLERAGLDPGCLDSRRGALRLRLQRVRLD